MLMNQTIPLHEKLNFIIYVFSRVLLSIGSHVYLFSVSYFILFHTGSSLYFALNMIISIVVNLMLLPFAGLLSDFGNKRKIIICGEIVYTFVLFSLLIYSLFFGISLTALYLTTFLTALTGPFVSNAFQSAMTDLFHRSRIQKVSGYVSAIMSSATIAGPIIGGVAYGFLEFTHIIFIFFVLYGLSTLLDFSLKFNLYSNTDPFTTEQKAVKNESPLQQFKTDISQGVLFIRDTPVLKKMLIVFAFINFFLATIAILPEKMMITELHFSPHMVGYVNAVIGIGSLIGGLVIGGAKKIHSPLSVQKYAVIIVALIIGVYPMPVYLDLDNVYAFIYIAGLGFSLTIAIQYANIPVQVFLQLVVPYHIKGRVFSTMSLISMSLMPFGSVVYGVLYDSMSYWLINLVSSLLLLFVAVLLYNRSIIHRSKEMYQSALRDAELDLDHASPADSTS